MKRLAFAVLLLLFVMPGVIAQDAEPEPAGTEDIQWLKLYQQAGRSWSHRIIHSTRGESPVVETVRGYVVSVEDGIARVDSETTDFDGNVTEATSRDLKLDDVSAEMKATAASDLPLVSLDMGFRSFDCRKHQSKTEGSQVTTWTSVEFHPLIVKRVKFEGDYTEVRKLKSFDPAEVDPWMLYRMQGRRWKVKMTTKFGNEENVTQLETTVVEVNEKSAKLSQKMIMENMDFEVPATEYEMEFKNAAAGAEPPDMEMLPEEEKTCPAGSFNCVGVNFAGAETWTSTLWPTLVVYSKTKSTTMELVEFDLGHDSQKFYRTAGNSYTTHTVTDIGVMKMESYNTWEVVSVEDDVSKYKLINKDAQKVETFSNDSEMPLSEHDGPLTQYTDQIEEMVSTPAGSFPAIRTEAQGGEMVSWTWNGILVRTEFNSDDIKLVTELIELSME